MPTYTILGGTGSTGSAVIRNLIAYPPHSLSLRIFVRSESKLLNLLPELSTRSNTTIIEGSSKDQHTLAKCLTGSNAIFSCIATNDSAPGTSIAIGTAAAIIATLKDVRASQGDKYIKPVILMLSSASMNESLDGKPPKAIKAVLNTALWYIYEDLRRAESLYREC